MSRDAGLEYAIYLKDILEILGWSKSKFYSFNSETHMKWRDELVRSGVIFYQYEGRPPHKRIKSFPSKLRNWISLKSSKGQII